MVDRKKDKISPIIHGFEVQPLVWAAGLALMREAGIRLPTNDTHPLLASASTSEILNALSRKATAFTPVERNVVEAVIDESIDQALRTCNKVSKQTVKALVRLNQRLLSE